MARVTVPAVLASAEKIKNTWTANPTFALGDFNLEAFTTALTAVTAHESEIDTKRHELQGLLDQRDDAAKVLQDLCTRALSGFRAVYGPDSPQYDQAGGTRRSERAPRRSKVAAKGGAGGGR